MSIIVHILYIYNFTILKEKKCLTFKNLIPNNFDIDL